MNGIHDMGGMQDMGRVEREANEPVFHHPWEGRVYAMTRVLRQRNGPWCLDAHRHAIELLPPADYLRMSYYEKWLNVLARQLVDTATATQAEVDAGQAAAGAPRATPAVKAADVPSTVDLRPTARRDAPSTARFKTGQRVRARNIHPAGHTRLPRYARGKTGVVARDRGVFVFPDAHAHDRGDKAQHLYSVRFTARELWGEAAGARDSVYLDMWDDYLERA
jgi:nitrile hydratase subunit beta